MGFIGYATATDCVSHRKPRETMEQIGFPVHITHLVEKLSTYNIMWSERLTLVQNRERSEARLSDITFSSNTFCGARWRNSMTDLQSEGRTETNLRCANDTTLLCIIYVFFQFICSWLFA